MPKPTRRRPGVCHLILILAGLVLLPRAAHPWAQNGHRIVAEIAERHLEPEVHAKITELLDGQSLAEVSTWPDDIRSFSEWDCAQALHFVTIKSGTEYPDQGVAEGDAIEAVAFYTGVLTDHTADSESRRVALKFLVHLVGDLHQPLHVGRGCDRGGNRLTVNWFEETVRFHVVWDEKLIASENLSFTEFADFADRASAQEIAAYQDSTPIDWAREAQQLLDDAYTCDVPGDRCPCFCGDCDDGLSAFGGCLQRECTLMAAGQVRLAYQYKAHAMPVIYRQLMKGGARLAGMLSWIFSDAPQPPESFRQMRELLEQLPNWPEAERAMMSCDGSH